jgi:sigma-B regulation protein RsbU (phosphoserine phosphatase)
MSIQPSLHSEPGIHPHRWQELVELAGILSSQYNLAAILDYATQVCENNYGCELHIWLEPTFRILYNQTDLNHPTLVNELSAIMTQAEEGKRLIRGTGIDGNLQDQRFAIAFPIVVREQYLGVIELRSLDAQENNNQGPIFGAELINQISHAIYLLGHLSHNEFLQKELIHLTAIQDISKSILSNLDRDSLLNSALSIIRMKFGFPNAGLLTPRKESNEAFTKVEISEEGIKIDPWYCFSGDADPVSWSITHREPVVINTTTFDGRFDPSVFTRGMQSEVVFPLLNGDILVGALVLASDSSDAFGPDTLAGFQLLAQNISVAIRNTELYYSEQARRSILDDLQSLIGIITTETSLDDLLQRLFDEVEKTIACDAAVIWLVDHSAGQDGMEPFIPTLRFGAARINKSSFKGVDQLAEPEGDDISDHLPNISSDSQLPVSQYQWIDEILESKLALIKNASPGFEPVGVMLGFADEYSAIGTPLLVENQPVGIMILVDRLSEKFGIDTQLLLDTISRYAAIAIENTKLFRAAHDQAWISTVLLQVTEATQSVDNIDDLLQAVCDILPGLADVEACMIFLWDQSLEAFFPQASNGFSIEQSTLLKDWNIYPGSAGAFDQLSQSKSPVILSAENLSDEITASVFPERDFDRDLMILFPMAAQIVLDGAILVDFTNSTLQKDSPQEIWDEKLSMVQGAAHQTAITLENLQLIKSQEEEAYISVALLQVAQAIVSLIQLDEILASIVRITPILVGVKRCIIYLWDENEQLFRHSESFGISRNDIESIGQQFSAQHFPLIDTIQQQNQIIYHPLGSEDTPLIWNKITGSECFRIEGGSGEVQEEGSIKLDAQSLINHERLLVGFPLSIKGELLGVMLIEEEDLSKSPSSLHIREKRLEIVRGITQQAAIAIKNELLQQEAVKSESMERELQLAREIQATFLPEKLPDIPGWDIAASWQPARQVGGDFYDLLQIDGDHIGIVIADVADKGMPAALFMTLIRTLIRAATKEKPSPAAVLKQVNTLLIPDSKHGMFVTVFYAVISISTGKVVYANAGHNPPIVKHNGNSELVQLTRTSIALGLFDDMEVDQREFSLQLGDWILLYTDGVTEAFSASEEMFGAERLLHLLSQGQFTTSQELVREIEQSVNEFIRGTDLSDDMTLTVITRKSESTS